MKILASDYDGTLNHGGIDDKKKAAISRWRAQGNIFVLVSGRGIDDVFRIYNEQDFECDYLLATNGAVILTTDKLPIRETRCDGQLIKDLCQRLFSLGCPMAKVETTYPHSGSYTVLPKNDEDEENYYTLDTLPKTEYFNQISTYLKDFEAAALVTEIITKEYGDSLTPLQNGNCIDIVKVNFNKAEGLRRLLEILEAQEDDIITVGDNINDYHMIKEFKSYAMENGVDLIKEIADYVTPGITELIEKELGD